MSDEILWMRAIGTPPQLPTSWMRAFALDCDRSRFASLNPFERVRLKARAHAFRDAADLVEQAKTAGPFVPHCSGA